MTNGLTHKPQPAPRMERILKGYIHMNNYSEINLTIDLEDVYKAISATWRAALMADNLSDQLHRWNSVSNMLDGMWYLVNYADPSQYDFKEEMDFLSDIADRHMYS